MVLTTSQAERFCIEAVATNTPLPCLLRDHVGTPKWRTMQRTDRQAMVRPLLKILSNTPVSYGGVQRDGVRSRFARLLVDMDELNANNSIALWTRYYWESQIAPILRGQEYLPASLEIDLTTYCDSGCFFCKEGRDKLNNEFPFEKLSADLNAFAGADPKPLVIYSGGGEPTSYSRFAEAMRLTHELGFEIYVSTHGGTIGTSEVPREVFSECATILKVSVGAAFHTTYNKVHNRAQKIPEGDIRTVDYVLDQCRQVALRRRAVVCMGEVVRLPRILMAMTVSPVNQNEVLLMAKKAVDAGADAVLFRPIITTYKQLLQIDEGLRQMEEAKARFGDTIEVLTFNHRIDYGYQREDYFARCIAHPVLNPDGAPDGSGTVTPCVYRRGNRVENDWLAACGAKTVPLAVLVSGSDYAQRVAAQDTHLHADGPKRCPRCRKVPNNIFLDILMFASRYEREIMRATILTLFPRNPVGEIIRGLH